MNIVKRFSDSLSVIWKDFKGLGIFEKAFLIFGSIVSFSFISGLLYLCYCFYWGLRDYFSPGASLFIASIAPTFFACFFILILVNSLFDEPSRKKTTNELLQELIDQNNSSKR